MLSARAIQLGSDNVYFPTKTPGRSRGRSENAHAGYGPSMTVNGKSNGVSSKTPFHPSTTQPIRVMKDAPLEQPQWKHTNTRPTKPLGDKTPFPNRVGINYQTPGPTSTKLSKLSLLGPDSIFRQDVGTPDTILRPSSTRKHVRVPKSASKSFETPMNKGNHWDVDISDTDIVIPEAEIQGTILEDNDFDEIEYMAPNTLDLAFQPVLGFDLPDYKILGSTLRNLAHEYHYDTFSPPEIEVTLTDLEPNIWDIGPLPNLEDDDPFSEARTRTKILAKQPSKPTVPRPIHVPKSYQSSAGTTVQPPTRTGVTTIRSGTSLSERAPFSRAVSSKSAVKSTVSQNPPIPSIQISKITTVPKARSITQKSSSMPRTLKTHASSVNSTTASSRPDPKNISMTYTRPATVASVVRPGSKAVPIRLPKPSTSRAQGGVERKKPEGLAPNKRMTVDENCIDDDCDDGPAVMLKDLNPEFCDDDFRFDV